jgi:hypothetical protein
MAACTAAWPVVAPGAAAGDAGYQAQNQATQGRDLSTLAPLRAFRARTVNMIQHEMTFFDPALLLQGQLAEHVSEMLPQFPLSTFLRYFGMNTTWYLHSHFVWLRL